MKELFHIYYDNLKHCVSLHHVDIEQFCSEETYFESIEYFKSVGIIKALIYAQIMLIPIEITKGFVADEEEANKFYFEERKDTFEESLNFDPFRTRIGDLIEDLYAICENQ